MIKYPNIEAERARNRMTKSSMCERLGITLGTYKNWQTGKNPISVNALMALAKMFGVTTDYLLGGD